MKLISILSLTILLVMFNGACAVSTNLKTKENNQNGATLSATPKPTISPGSLSDTSPNELCNQLSEIKHFPSRNPAEKNDPYYDSIMSKGTEVVPCLIDQITNETPADDPRSAPHWEHYKVGDTAVFLLARLSKDPNILEEMLPPSYRAEWKTNGVYAYFNYVSVSENRKELQNWWRAWAEENLPN